MAEGGGDADHLPDTEDEDQDEEDFQYDEMEVTLVPRITSDLQTLYMPSMYEHFTCLDESIEYQIKFFQFVARWYTRLVRGSVTNMSFMYYLVIAIRLFWDHDFRQMVININNSAEVQQNR